MRTIFPAELERGRIKDGPYGSSAVDGPFGAFEIMGPKLDFLRVIANGGCQDSFNWEHVSVSLPNRTPTWEEMDFIKNLFWGEDECVVQFHPPKKDYVNYHPHCLHMWKHVSLTFPMPPSQLVGPR